VLEGTDAPDPPRAPDPARHRARPLPVAESRLLGCVYVDPPDKQGADADVFLWVRSDEEGGDLEEVLEGEVRRWLDAEWPFATVRWPGRDLAWEDWDRLPDA